MDDRLSLWTHVTVSCEVSLITRSLKEDICPHTSPRDAHCSRGHSLCYSSHRAPIVVLHPGQHGHRGGSGAHHAALEIDALETQARKRREGSSHQLTLNAGWLADFILPESAWRSPELLPTGLQQLSQMGRAVCSGLSEALGPLVPAAGAAPALPRLVHCRTLLRGCPRSSQGSCTMGPSPQGLPPVFLGLVHHQTFSDHECLPSAGPPQGTLITWSELKPLPGCGSLK